MDYLNQALSSLSSQFGTALPRMIGALVLLIVGLFVARIIRGVARKALQKSGIDNIIKRGDFSLASTLAKVIYFILVLFVLMLVLDMMGLSMALDPIKDMLSKFLGYIPNIIGAGIIGYVGYIVANIAKEAVGMVTSGLNDLGMKYGLGDVNLSGVLKQVIFIFLFIPIALVALDTLNISTISDPAKHMLQSLFDAIPNIIAAAIILFVFVFGGRFVSKMVGDLLRNMNIDKASESLGISSMLGERYTLSDIVSKIIFFYMAFFGTMTAVEKLELVGLSNILNDIMSLSVRSSW